MASKAREPKKPRNKRRLLLFVCMSATCLTQLTSLLVVFIVDPSLFRTSNGPFIDALPSDTGRTAAHSALGVFIARMITCPLGSVYFLVFWHRFDKSAQRSLGLGIFTAIDLGLAMAGRMEARALADAPFVATDVAQVYPASNAIDIEEKYGHLVDSTTRFGNLILYISVVDGFLRLVGIIFWLWLLPDRWRLPWNYEPVRAKAALGTRHSGSVTEIEMNTMTPSSRDSGRMNELFQKHEELFWRKRNQEKAMKVTTSKAHREATRKTDYMKLATRDGPALDGSVRYWAGRKPPQPDFLMFLLGGVLARLAQELGFFIAIKVKNFPCTWLCRLSYSIPWLYIELVTIAVIMVLFRWPFDYALLGKVKVDVAMLSLVSLLSLIGLVCDIIRIFDWSEATYKETLDQNPDLSRVSILLGDPEGYSDRGVDFRQKLLMPLPLSIFLSALMALSAGYVAVRQYKYHYL